MPNDATFELLADLQNKQKAAIAMVAAPIYNIDDMDPKFCMINLMFSGCYCLVATKTIDPARPGMIYIDGAATEPHLPGQPAGQWHHAPDTFLRVRFGGVFSR